MAKANVYVVTANDIYTVSWSEAIGKTFALEKDIAILAKKSGAEIHFHHYTSTAVGTPPAVLLECSEDFLDKVKRLSSVASIAPLNKGDESSKTIRREDMPQIEPPQSQKNPGNNGFKF
jgi:hypothetical protein